MIPMDKQKPSSRLDYSGSLKPVIDRLAIAYGLGKISSISIIEVGYEDCNVKLETTTSNYIAKIFSKARSGSDISRYTKIMELVTSAGIKHPDILLTKAGDLLYTDSNLSMVLMKFIEGKTFLELDRSPNRTELEKIIAQAAKINKIDYKPPYLTDSWAIPNIKEMYKRVGKFIAPEDKSLVETVISNYSKIPVATLPHCFVHGDFTKANIINGNNGELYVLDFSVSNWYPRIQELAVIAANLLYDKSDPTPLRKKCDMVASFYSKQNSLTKEEEDNLYHYALAGVAMEFMGSHQERFINGNDTEETRYWFNLGHLSLIKELR
jgi:Ser/Thr protein kinase RdoA (MazF antagonist)